MSVWVLRYEKETKKFKKRVLTFLSFKYPSFFCFSFSRSGLWWDGGEHWKMGRENIIVLDRTMLYSAATVTKLDRVLVNFASKYLTSKFI